MKSLACLAELYQHDFVECMARINDVARKGELTQYSTYSRIWEYPRVWLKLSSLKQQELRLLDIGSSSSPFPWFLAMQGFNIIISDVTANHWRVWKRAKRRLGVSSVDLRILDSQNLLLPTGSVDIYLSISVIEHVPDKLKAIHEAARVLRPGGLLIMTYDICEPDMGMSFPEWNGRALTMKEFDELFRQCPWFESDISKSPWNKEDIPDYLAWHRTTAHYHNYVNGAAIVQRNHQAWVRSVSKDYSRVVLGKFYDFISVLVMYIRATTRIFILTFRKEG